MKSLKSLNLSNLIIILILTLMAVTVNAQIDWVNDPGYPVMNQYDNWDSVTIMPYYLLPCDSGYHFWFGGSNDSMGCGAVTHYKVGHAFSYDGLNWTVNPEPVLVADTTSPDATINSVSVVQDGGIFKMWFTYADGTTSGDAVGYATSPDGFTWTEYAGNPVLESGTNPADWDYNEIYDLRVIFEDTVYKMWYTGYDIGSTARVGVAKSYNGIDWEKHPNNPIIHETTFSGYDLLHIQHPNVIKDGPNNYKAFFFVITSSGFVGNIYACSYDGLEWRFIVEDGYSGYGWMNCNIIRDDTTYLTYGGYVPSYECDELSIGLLYRRYIPIDTTEHYFNIKTGNRYYYSYYINDETRYQYFIIGDSTEVYDSTEQASFPGYAFTYYMGFKGEPPSMSLDLYFYYNDGVWVWYDPTGTLQTPSYLRYKDQIIPGDTWLDVGNVEGGPDDTTYYWCLGDTSITTPLGDFDVMFVLNENPPDHCEKTWFTEGGGFVRVESCDDHSMLMEIDSAYIDGEWIYPACCTGLTGNVDCSESEDPDISDITILIDHLYLSKQPLCCHAEADCNGSGGDPDISDVTLLIDHLYLSHMPLAECP